MCHIFFFNFGQLQAGSEFFFSFFIIACNPISGYSRILAVSFAIGQIFLLEKQLWGKKVTYFFLFEWCRIHGDSPQEVRTASESTSGEISYSFKSFNSIEIRALDVGYEYIGCPTGYQTQLAGGPLLLVATIRRTTDTHYRHIPLHFSHNERTPVQISL
jgi:hypothetical protein